MLRSNTKKARTNVQMYIAAGYDPAGYPFSDPETFEDMARNIWTVFTQEADPYTMKTAGNQAAFIQWTSGLPSIIDTTYYLHSAVEDLRQILEETAEEAARYSEPEAERYLSYLIYREVSKAAGR